MNENPMSKLYHKLTPEERFALAENAAARRDDAEASRLASSAPRLTLSIRHDAPVAEAFDEIALLVLLELLDLAADYFDALDRCRDAEDMETASDTDDKAGDEDAGAPGEPDTTSAERSLSKRERHSERCRGIFLARGFLLKTKVTGWKRWCERRHLPPFRIWQMLPGYDRLQRALDLVENGAGGRGSAYTPKDMLRWLNSVRPANEPELLQLPNPCTPEFMPDALERVFQDRVRFHG